MAASLLFRGTVKVENMPLIEDVSRMRELLGILGIGVKSDGRNLEIDPDKINNSEIKKEIGERLRASIVLVGPLLARTGRAVFPYPGGCVIGRRPVDIFLDGWKAMGADIKENNGFEITAEKLKGIDFTFRVISVTATETLMMSAVLAHGKTTLRNSAMEPEIPALAEFLNKSGANIRGAGTKTIEIEGTGGKFLLAKEPFFVIPDRIEAGSFLILGAVLGEKLKVKNCDPKHLVALVAKLVEAGVSCEVGPDWITVRRPAKIKTTNIETKEYPGFPTDLQAPFAVLMTQANGESKIFETIWESRFGYVNDLKKMGANISLIDEHHIIIKGPTELAEQDIESPDLRAGLAFLMAAMLARGESIVRNIYQIDRGYEKIDERLRGLGADIERVN